jgi:antitoxin component YwqK of YwqJK toxin-antitoxin module
MTHFKWTFIALLLLIISTSCKEVSNSREHYFLDGYDNLVFKDISGNTVLPGDFISRTTMNGYRYYRVRDTSLTLVHKRSGEPYTGYIRTFHRDRYNIQGEFEDGKIFRLRYWHPNRILAMDQKFREGTLSLWSSAGSLVASANDDEVYYYYTGSQTIKEIISDTMHSYYNREGDLERYTVRRDTLSILYDSEGNMRRYFPFKPGVGLHGVIKEWHPNGKLKVIGEYVNGRQSGVWIEYDSIGRVVNREEYPDRSVDDERPNQ